MLLPIMSSSCGRTINVSKRQDIGREKVMGSSFNGDSLLHYN